MTYLSIFLIAISLSMDAFAASISKGLDMPYFHKRKALLIATLFGGFQALMPFLGWLLASQFTQFIAAVDHWIAFFLLVIIGGKMIYEAYHSDPSCNMLTDSEGKIEYQIKELILLAIATSIDALAIGITFALLGYPLFTSIVIIGLTTFILSWIGVWIGALIGCHCGKHFEKHATLLGGILLILIGFKILLQDLF